MGNSVLEAYRQRFDDPRSDDDITLDLGSQYPDTLKARPDFGADFVRINKELSRATRPPISQEFPRTLKYGVDTVQAKLYDTAALAGDVLHSDTLKNFGEEGYRRNIEEAQPNAPTVPRIEDIEGSGDAARYVLGLVGSQAPQLGLTAGAAVGGALAAPLVGLGAGIGAAATAGVVGFSQMQNRAELKAQGAKDVAGTSIAVGTLGAILESIVPLKVTSVLLRGASEKAAAEMIKRIVREVPINALTEMSTEVSQEIVSMAGELYANRDNKNFSIPREQIISRLVNNGLAGGLLGGVMGGIEAIPKPRDPAGGAQVPPPPPVTQPVPPPPSFDPTVEQRFGIDAVPPKTRAQIVELKSKVTDGTADAGDIAAVKTLDPAERLYFTLLGEDPGTTGTTPVDQTKPGTDNENQRSEVVSETSTQTDVQTDGQGNEGRQGNEGLQVGQATTVPTTESPLPESVIVPGDGAVPDDGTFTEAEIAEIEARYANVGKKQKPVSQPISPTVAEPTQSLPIAVSEAPVVAGAVSPAPVEQAAPVLIPPPSVIQPPSPSRTDPRRAAVMALLNQKEGQDLALSAAAKRLQDRLAIVKAEAKTNTVPTPEQKEDGNYAKGLVTLDGIQIQIENPIGTTRSGTTKVPKPTNKRDKIDKPWSVVMPATYGEIKGVTVDGREHKATGADGDKVDIYIGPNTASDKVWVIDQKDLKSGRFDEHKVMFGFSSKEAAMATYIGAFSDNQGANRIGSITEMTKAELREWFADGATKVPLGSITKDALLTADDVQASIDWNKAPVAELVWRVGSRTGNEGMRFKKDEELRLKKEKISVKKEAFFDAEGRDLDATNDIEFEVLDDDKQWLRTEVGQTSLRDELTSQSEVAGAADSDTHRITFFEDGVTGVVIGLPTYQTRSRGKEVRVGLLPGKVFGDGQLLDDLMATGNYAILSSVLVKKAVRATDPDNTIVFKDYAAYEEKLRDPAKDRVASNRDEVQANLEAARLAAQPQRLDAEGNAVAVQSQEAPKDATTDENLETLHNGIFESLMIHGKGKIQAGLGIREFGAIVLHAFSQMSELRMFAARAVLKDPKALTIIESEPTEKRANKLSFLITERLYETYKAGAFQSETNALTVGQGHLGKAGGTVTTDLARLNEGVSGVGSAVATTTADAARANELLFRTVSPVTPGHSSQATVPVVLEAMGTMLEGIAHAGFNVGIFKQNLESSLAFIRTQAGGAWNNSGNMVALAHADAVAPTPEGLRTVLHEAAHGLSSKEAQVIQDAIHRAIDALSDEQLGLKGSADPRIRSDNPAGLESIVQERMAENMAQSIDLTKARGFASAIWRLAKDLWLSAAKSVAQALYGANIIGKSAILDSMALDWFRNNLERIARGENRWSMIDWLGGGRLRTSDIATLAPKLTGQSDIAFRWNVDTGRMEYRDVLPVDAAAMRFNLFRSIESVNAPRTASADLNPEVKLPDVAAQNSLENGLQALWVSFKPLANTAPPSTRPWFTTYQTFLQFILPPKFDAPSVVIAEHNAEIQRHGLAPVNPAIQITDLSENSQRDAANRAVGIWNLVVSKWSARAQEADTDLSGNYGSKQSRFDRNAKRVSGLETDYTNVDTLLQRAKTDLFESLQAFSDAIKDVKSGAKESGILAQTIRMLEGEMTDDIARQYQKAMNDLYTRLTSDDRTQTRFYDLLRAVADLEIDFDMLTPQQVRETVRSQVLGQPNSPMLPLVAENGRGGFTRESNALLSIVISFARRDALSMASLALQKNATQFDKIIVDDTIKLALSQSKTAMSQAVSKANSSGKLKGKLMSVLKIIDKIQKEQRLLRNQLDDAKLFHDFHSHNISVIDAHRQSLEKILGAQGTMFEATKGALYPLPPGPNAPAGWSRDPKNLVEFHYTRDAAAQKTLKEHIATMQAYKDAHPDGTPGYKSADWNAVEQAHGVLIDNEIQHMAANPQNSLMVRAMGSVNAMLKLVGLPESQAIVRKLNRFVDIQHRFNEGVKKIWTDWENAERKAMKALGITHQPYFRQAVFDSGMTFIQNRKDIQFGKANQDDAVRAVMPELRLHLMGDAKIRDAIVKGAWPAIEAFFMQHQRAQVEATRMSDESGIKINDDAHGIFRRTKGAPLFEAMRVVSGTTYVMFDRMRVPWDLFFATTEVHGVKTSPWKRFADDLASDPAKATAALQAIFTPEVWRDFVTPIANRPGISAFNQPATANGLMDRASRANTQAALAASKGSITAFVSSLYQLSGGSSDPNAFLIETVDTFHSFYSNLLSMKKEASSSQPLTISPGQHLLMEARRSEEFPSEWLEFRAFDRVGMHGIIEHFAFHGALGRDGAAVWADFDAAHKVLKNDADNYKILYETAVSRAGGKSGKTFSRELKAEATARGVDLHKAAEAAQRMNSLTNARFFFENYIRMRAEVGIGAKPVANVIGAMVGAVLQGVGSAITDTTTLFKPIMEFGLSGTTLRMAATGVKILAAGNVGASLSATLGVISKWQMDHFQRLREIGAHDSDNEITLKEKLTAVLHGNQRTFEASMFKQAKADASRASNIMAGVVRAGLSTGFSRRVDSPFPTFKPFAPFSHIGLMINAGAIGGMWEAYSDMVSRAVKHYQLNPANLSDPTFKFTAAQLHYTSKLGGMIDDSRTFDEMTNRLADNGMSIERLASDYVQRGTGPILTSESLKRIAMMTRNDIVSDPSLASRSARVYSNRTLTIATPLLGWTIQQMVGVPQSLRGPQGQIDKRALKNGLVSLGAMMGVSLAYSLLRDLYDEDILNKKANVMSLKDEALTASVIDRVARIGMPFGFGGDFINSFVNVDTNREFSIDSRVFAMNSATQLWKAASTWWHQEESTYATVWRQVAISMGGSGYLQNAQILNNMLSLDNQEARITSRTNVNNWLRTAGRTIGLEVKTSKGQSYTPTPMSPWITEMQLAALAGDYAAFNDAKRGAMQVARDMREPDPAKYVATSFQSRHPLKSVFKSPPTHDQYRKLLAAMPDGGREDVQEAVGLFNRFLERLGLSAYEGKAEERSHGRAVGLSVDPMAMRRMAVSSLGGFGF